MEHTYILLYNKLIIFKMFLRIKIYITYSNDSTKYNFLFIVF